MSHVRADRRRRPHHGRVHGADREGLQDRQVAGRSVGLRWRAGVRTIPESDLDGVGGLLGWLRISRPEYTMALHSRARSCALRTQSSGSIRSCSCWSPPCTSACTERSSACFRHPRRHLRLQIRRGKQGMLYTAKGMGALWFRAPPTSPDSRLGTGVSIAMSFNLLAAALALFVLKPMRVRHLRRAAKRSHRRPKRPRVRTT